jgi:hypothetical protein
MVGLSKGAIYTAARMFTEKRFGKEAVGECLSKLDPADREILRGVIPMGWYPLEPTVRFGECVDRIYGTGDLALVREIGRFSAEWQVNAFHKLILRFKPGEWLIQRGFNLWKQYHDTGRWEIEHPEPNHVVGRLQGFSVAMVGWCTRFQGWLTRAAELTGARDVVIEHPRCRARGDDLCEYNGNWKSS